MSLYGIDFLRHVDGRLFISEISGVAVGMGGFEKIYGDKRVSELVYKKLQDDSGLSLSIPDYDYYLSVFNKNKSFKSLYYNKLVNKWDDFKKKKILLSKKSHSSWIMETVNNLEIIDFDLFSNPSGKDSIILNYINWDGFDGSLVNPYYYEEITRNKALQSILMKNSEFSKYFPDFVFAGLGSSDVEGVESLLSKYNSFILKPILGFCGKGVEKISKNELEKLGDEWGEVYPQKNLSLIERLLLTINKPEEYLFLEDLIEKGEYHFQEGISIVQPFINTKKKIKNISNDIAVHSSIRVIVCNGEYIDAYLRVNTDKDSINNPIVNYSCSAKAFPFELDGLSDLSEGIIREYELACSKLNGETFRYDLYKSYFNPLDRKNKYMDEIKRNNSNFFMSFLAGVYKT